MMSSSQSNRIALNLGETFASRAAVVVTCHGLGSCIALFLFDVHSTNSAGAHIMLPGESLGDQLAPTCYAHNAIDTLLSSLELRGSQPANIRAALAGGANVANLSGLDVGKENIESVVKELRRRDIGISQMSVGDSAVRTARFCSTKKRIEVKTLRTN